MKNVTTMLAPLLQDPAFKAKLIADPKAALAERGLKIPEGLTIEVHENTPTVFHLVLPSTTASSALSDDELAAAAGGWGGGPGPDNPTDPMWDCWVPAPL
ncbi:MAG: hypothetical protein RLZZ565_1630 [Planctomycetota bacterium]